MAKIIGIVKNDSITGVQYGTVDVPENVITIKYAKETFKKAQSARTHKARNERTKKK